MTFVQFLNTILSSLTVVGQIFCLIMFTLFIFKKKQNALITWVGTHGILIGAIAAFLSIAGSLSYSDIVGYEPCKLCWWQRIFMYPQFLLLGIALFKKSYQQMIATYALIFSSIGGFIALWHYLLQRGVVDVGCSVVGYSVSCAKVFVMNFGYITIPLMAFTAFMMIMVSMLAFRRTTLEQGEWQTNTQGANTPKL